MVHSDCRGYYATLQSSVHASDDELRASYRKLAKIHHPDVNPKATAGDQFKKISEAYAILSDADQRARYDAECFLADDLEAAGSDKRQGQAAFQPLKCSKCSKVTAQPRFAVFWQVYSFLYWTRRQPFQGIFCAECAQKTAFKCSAISAVTGWWSVPGLILNPLSIVRNALGGKSKAVGHEDLIWHNALAFVSMGDLKLGYALARIVKNSGSKLSGDASTLMDDLERQGISKQTPELIDPWRWDWMEFSKHIALLILVPSIIYLWSSYDAIAKSPNNDFDKRSIYDASNYDNNYKSQGEINDNNYSSKTKNLDASKIEPSSLASETAEYSNFNEGTEISSDARKQLTEFDRNFDLAKQGNAVAQFYVGWSFETGNEIYKDAAQAASWYTKAATRGSREAQYNLGLLYVRGEGVPKDLVQAHKWFNLASASGSAENDEIRSEAAAARDEISNEMSSEEIEKAQDLAVKWRAIIR